MIFARGLEETAFLDKVWIMCYTLATFGLTYIIP